MTSKNLNSTSATERVKNQRNINASRMLKAYTSGADIYSHKADVKSFLRKTNRKIPISCMFLSHFEMKKGNVVVWSKKWSETGCDVNLQDIELKSLPSGVHEVSDDVINFVVPKNKGGSEDYYYGTAYFRQNGHEMAEISDQLDRNEVKMYSLGVIINPNFQIGHKPTSEFLEWKPNQFTCANEYVHDLETLLTHWFTKKEFENFELFENFFDANSLTNNTQELTSPGSQKIKRIAQELIPSRESDEDINSTPNIRRQMLEYLPYWTRMLGPLIYTLWKSCLLGERVLILNPTKGSFETCNSLSYCLSLISLIPKSVQVSGQDDHYIRPLFTIGISDITSVISEYSGNIGDRRDNRGFIACTSDEILVYKTELYDKLLRIPSDRPDEVNTQSATISTSANTQVKATPFEYELTEGLFKKCLHEDISLLEKSLYFAEVEPISWTQYIIDGMYWWATAGYVKTPFHENFDGAIPDPLREDSEFEILTDIVEYFHSRTFNIFNKLQAIIAIAENESPNEVISIPFKALREMDLDCFSIQDHEFIVALAEKWLHKKIRISDDYYSAFC